MYKDIPDNQIQSGEVVYDMLSDFVSTFIARAFIGFSYGLGGAFAVALVFILTSQIVRLLK